MAAVGSAWEASATRGDLPNFLRLAHLKWESEDWLAVSGGRGWGCCRVGPRGRISSLGRLRESQGSGSPPAERTLGC